MRKIFSNNAEARESIPNRYSLMETGDLFVGDRRFNAVVIGLMDGVPGPQMSLNIVPTAFGYAEWKNGKKEISAFHWVDRQEGLAKIYIHHTENEALSKEMLMRAIDYMKSEEISSVNSESTAFFKSKRKEIERFSKDYLSRTG